MRRRRHKADSPESFARPGICRDKDYAPINALFNKLNEKKVSIRIQKKVEVNGKKMAVSCSPPDAYGRI